MSEVVPQESSSEVARIDDVRTDLERFQYVVEQKLAEVGLPSGQVFVDVGERHTMVSNIGGVLATLDSEVLDRSHYVSKMIAATTVGLFDAALNYLWDELVNELRRRVTGFDLKYFYDIAAGSTELRKHLKDESDLVRIEDASLLRAAKEIGLLTDVGFQRLDHIRYMRNYASAAHPNQVTISGLDLANWLQVCIREVITTPPDNVTANTGRLLANIKKERLDNDAVRGAAAFFDQLPQERADTLANGLFGLYTDPERTPIVADNVRTLWPRLWPFVSENTRASYGIRHARAHASAETSLATSARELIDLVDGTSYLTEEIRVVEIDEVLDDLRRAHDGMNNFHNEIGPARRLDNLVGEQGDVPAALREKYVKLLVEVFLGNRFGVSFASIATYESLLQRMDGQLAGQALRAFLQPNISVILWASSPRAQWGALLDIIEPKLTSTIDRDLMKEIRGFSGTPDQLALDTKLRRLAEKKP